MDDVVNSIPILFLSRQQLIEAMDEMDLNATERWQLEVHVQNNFEDIAEKVKNYCWDELLEEAIKETLFNSLGLEPRVKP